MNKCIFTGRFVEDPRILRSKSGSTYTRFTLAVNDRVYNKAEDRWLDKASFFPCIAYGEIAQYIVAEGSKGAKISLCARADQSSYKKDANHPVKREIIFTVTEADIEKKEKKWTSKRWV